MQQAFIDLGGKFDAGCTTGPQAFFPSAWYNDTMVHLGNSDFDYRQCWGNDTAGHDWDKTQVKDNTIYMQNKKVNALIACGGKGKHQANARPKSP